MATALDNYSNFAQSVLNWLDVNASDFATSQLEDCVRLAQKRVEAEMRIRENEKALTGTITGGAVTIPTDYIELKQAYVTVGGVQYQLKRTETEELYSLYADRSVTGTPKYIARNVGSFVFGPVPSGIATLSGTYYKSFPELPGTTLSLINSASGDYNALYARYPHLYLFATCAEAESLPTFGHAQALQIWEGKYQALKALAHKMDRQERFSGSSLRVQAVGGGVSTIA